MTYDPLVSWFDELKKKLFSEAAEKVVDEALDDFADDLEKHLVGDMSVVEEHERELAEKAAAEEQRFADRVKEVHEQRMSAEDRAREELARLKAQQSAGDAADDGPGEDGDDEPAAPDEPGPRKTL